MSSSSRIDRGPWPEPDDAGDRLSAAAERAGADAAATARELDAATDRVVDQLDDVDDLVGAWDARTDPKGSRGVALAVAGMNVAFLLILPVLLVVGIYTFITIYAIVKAASDGSDTADAGVILLGVVGLVTFFVLLIGIGGWAIGRAADPKKRR